MRGISRLLAALIALVACIALSATAGARPGASSAPAAGAPSSAEPAKAKQKARAEKVKALTTGQRQILRRKAIKVKVLASRAGRLKLTGKSQTA